MEPRPVEPRGYRREIDGLRAIAVMAVLVYHAGFLVGGTQVLFGGYLGVDVFFVISGYLITSILLAEFASRGTFSFRRFYGRRTRRLLPALLLVMLASLPVGWAYLTPTQLVDLAWSLIASLFFGSNFYWQQTLQEYGAESGLVKPFLHTWSLAVEEQYYLVTPLLLLGIYRGFRRQAVPILFVLLVASLGLSEYLNDRGDAFAFYMLPTRFWELAVGALLAHRAADRGGVPEAPGWRGVLPGLGLTLIVLPMFLMPFDGRHPGLLTLVPVLGTALLIGFTTGRDPVSRCLSAGLPRTLGLISYSLYLWHYPIFAFGRLRAGEPDGMDKLVWFALSLAASLLTYRFVEVPFRDRAKIGTATAWGVLGAAVLAVLAACAVCIRGEGAPARLQSLADVYGINEFDNQVLQRESWSLLNEIAAERLGRDPAATEGRSFRQEKQRGEAQLLPWFEEPDSLKVLIVGDSHAKGLFNALALNPELYGDLELAFWEVSLGRTFGGPSQRAQSKNERARKALGVKIEGLVGSPNFQQADRIVLANRYYIGKGAAGEQAFVDMLGGVLGALSEGGKALTLMGNTVEYRASEDGRTPFDEIVTGDDPEVVMGEVLPRRYFEARSDPLPETGRSLEVTNGILRSVARTTGVEFLDPGPLLCDEDAGTCLGITPEGYKVYFDYAHWTLEGARHLGRELHARGLTRWSR